MGAWFLGIIRGLFASIDKIIALFIDGFYALIFNISNVQIFSNRDFAEFASRLTVIITIFMLFKLSFSFLNYIINPDNMNDKSKGVTKIIQNVIVSLVLLVSYQFVFDKAMELQNRIILNDTIPKLILGTKTENEMQAPSKLSFYLYSSFIIPNQEIRTKCEGYAFNGSFASTTDGCDLSEYTNDVVNLNLGGKTYLAPNDQLNAIVSQKYTAGLFDNVISWKKGEIFAFDYMYIVSTAFGVVAALLLLSFCFDIAIRTIKLAFFRLIAPIPIISYIDPNKGEGIFKKWLTNVGKTYADLFVRLIAIYFAIYVIQIVINNYQSLSYINGNSVTNPLVVIFIIIGALMFAKQFPKLFQDITGISFENKLQLNPLKRIQEQALGGKALSVGAAGVLGGTIAGVGNLGNKVMRFKETAQLNGGGTKGKVLAGLGAGLSGIAGTASGFWNSSRNASSSGKIIDSVIKGVGTANTHRTEREIGYSEGASTLGIMGAKLADKFGLETDYQRMNRRIRNAKSVQSTFGAIEKEIGEEYSIKAPKYLTQIKDSTIKANAKQVWDDAVNASIKFSSYKNVDIYTLRKEAGAEYDARLQKVKTALDDFNSSVSLNNFIIDATTTDKAIENNISLNEISRAKALRDAYKLAISVDRDTAINNAEKQYEDERKALQQLAFNTDQAAKALFFKLLDEGIIEKASIKESMETIRRTVENSEDFSEKAKTTYNGNDFEAIKKQIDDDNNAVINLEGSEEFRRAKASHEAANLGEKSYNNMLDTHATKQKN